MGLRVADKLAAGREPVRIVAFGDSVTGIYYHTGGRRAWPEMLEMALRRLYPEASPSVANAGVGGNTTVDALARLDADVLSLRPDLVVVMFGLNDVARLASGDYRAGLRRIAVRCREVGAEVLLCTPNSVYDEDPGRPMARLATYAESVRELARELGAPVADHFAVYERVRAVDGRAWSALMSETIHPNMRGHQVMAEEVAWVISGRRISLSDVGPAEPGIPRTLERLGAGESVRVTAMPPYDAWIGAALGSLDPRATVQVSTWQTGGQSLADIEARAKARGWHSAQKAVADGGTDLVLVAVPAGARAAGAEDFLRRYSWVLNWSLSFGRSEWDCLVTLPSVARPHIDHAEQVAEALALSVVRAHDLPWLARASDDSTPAVEVFAAWIKRLAGFSG